MAALRNSASHTGTIPLFQCKSANFDKGRFFSGFCDVCGHVNKLARNCLSTVSADMCSTVCDICTIVDPGSSEFVHVLAYIARVGSKMLSSDLKDSYIADIGISWYGSNDSGDNMVIECVMGDLSFMNFIRMSFFVGDDGSLVNYRNVMSDTYAVAMQNTPTFSSRLHPFI